MNSRRLILAPHTSGHRSGSTLHWESPCRCPLWVKSGHMQCNTACPLCPLKRTFARPHSSPRKRPNCRGSAKGRDVPNRVSCQRRNQLKIFKQPAETSDLVLDVVLPERVPIGCCIDGDHRFAEPRLGRGGEPHHAKIGADL